MRFWQCLLAASCVHALVLAIPLRPKLDPSEQEIWVRIVKPSFSQSPREAASPDSQLPANPPTPELSPQQSPFPPEVLPEIPDQMPAQQEFAPSERPSKEIPSKPTRKQKPQTDKPAVMPPESPSTPPRPVEQIPETAFPLQPEQETPATSAGLQGPKPGPAESPRSMAKVPLVESSFGTSEGPRFIERIIPDYPLSARRMRREGTVLLRLHIDEGGRLLEARVVQPAGYGLDEAALEAVRRSTFAPATKAGVPVECWATLAVRFVLEDRR